MARGWWTCRSGNNSLGSADVASPTERQLLPGYAGVRPIRISAQRTRVLRARGHRSVAAWRRRGRTGRSCKGIRRGVAVPGRDRGRGEGPGSPDCRGGAQLLGRRATAAGRRSRRIAPSATNVVRRPGHRAARCIGARSGVGASQLSRVRRVPMDPLPRSQPHKAHPGDAGLPHPLGHGPVGRRRPRGDRLTAAGVRGRHARTRRSHAPNGCAGARTAPPWRPRRFPARRCQRTGTGRAVPSGTTSARHSRQRLS